jgi:hypothetical protein
MCALSKQLATQAPAPKSVYHETLASNRQMVNARIEP